LSKVNKAMKSFHLEEDIIAQVFINELLKLIGVNSFNDMLMRRNFASWKRGTHALVKVAIPRLIYEPVDSDANPVQHHPSGGMV
jgi:energy-converting hydrogenase A subunit M